MQPKNSSRRKKKPGLIETVCLLLAVLFVASLYAIGFVGEITGKVRETNRERRAAEIIKGQIQPPLPGAAMKKSIGGQSAAGAEKR